MQIVHEEGLGLVEYALIPILVPMVFAQVAIVSSQLTGGAGRRVRTRAAASQSWILSLIGSTATVINSLQIIACALLRIEGLREDSLKPPFRIKA